MRALFIINSQEPIYGSSRSVSTLIRNLDADIDIIFPVTIKKSRKINKEKVRKYYGNNVKNIYFLPQPSHYSVMEGEFPLSTHVKSGVKELLMLFFKRIYKKIYQKGQYDFIHLNSVILYPLLDRRYPMFLHIREVVRKKRGWINKNFCNCVNRAHGVIFINHAAKKACPNLDVPQTILVNPFDQLNVKNVEWESALKAYGMQKDQTVYAVIGNILPIKGVLRVINAFKKAKLRNAVLLIVGEDKAHGRYSNMVKAIAAGDSMIRELGEIENMDPIYRITDYVVRGDEVVGFGRTVFEGLFSGCNVIVPCDDLDDPFFPDVAEEFANKIIPYKLRDEDSLAEAFRKTQHQRIEDRNYFSNVSSYAAEFIEFINNNTRGE